MAENAFLLEDPPSAPESPPSDAPPPDTPPAPPDPPPPGDAPPKNPAQERIEELLAQQKAEREAMQQYADFWREQALKGGKTPGSAPAPQADLAPTLDQFDSTDKWAKAYAEWNGRELERRAEAVFEAKLAARQRADNESSAATQWQSRLAEYAKEHPDAIAVISNPALPITKDMRDVITASEHGIALAHHLGKNPLEAHRISRLSPTQAAAALGRLEAQIAAAKSTPPPVPSKKVVGAPPPPEPLGGGGSATTDDMKLPLHEFLAKITRRR